MTKGPTKEEMDARSIYDPPPGTVHIIDLIEQVKDGMYAKDKLSHQLIGMILWAIHIGLVKEWEGMCFQVPLVHRNKKEMRLCCRHITSIGLPFLGPDGRALTLKGRTLHGSNSTLGSSHLTTSQVRSHPEYTRWLSINLYAGGDKDSTTYDRTSTRNTKEECDAYVNNRAYRPGPDSRRPAHVSAS